MDINNTQAIYISIQDHTGDRKLKLQWNPNPKEPSEEKAIEHIEEMFKDLQQNGYRFFSVKKVLGIFEKKGKEVKYYDSALGELIYEKDPNFVEGVNKRESSVTMYEVEKHKQEKYEEPQRFDPSKENVDTSRDYVATRPMRAG